jgi:hypothetical protein
MTANEPKELSPGRELCWICGSPATTREHLIKRTDLAATFGSLSQNRPIRVHSAKWRNRRVGSLKSDVLKFPPNLCEHCNSTRTQPYDRAWQELFEHLRALQIRGHSKTYLRANRVFPHNTRRHLTNVQLYFVKLFGCRAAQGNIPLDIRSFAEAIKRGAAHPRIYLEFLLIKVPVPLASVSDVECVNDEFSGRCVAAAWVYQAGNVGVRVMYAAEGQQRAGMKRSWHSGSSTTKLPILMEEIDLKRLASELEDDEGDG